MLRQFAVHQAVPSTWTLLRVCGDGWPSLAADGCCTGGSGSSSSSRASTPAVHSKAQLPRQRGFHHSAVNCWHTLCDVQQARCFTNLQQQPSTWCGFQQQQGPLRLWGSSTQQMARGLSTDARRRQQQQQQQQQGGGGGGASTPAAAKKPQLLRNHQIKAPTLTVVFPDGTTQVLSLAEARAAAEAAGLDLVEVNGRTTPPVARILDYGKMSYEAQQKAEAADKQRRLQQKLATPKEMQFSARIADHDLEVKMRKVTDWLEAGHRVLLVVKHRSEELEAATDALSYLTTRLQSEFKVEVGATQPQRRAVAALVKPLGQPPQAGKQQ